MTSLDAIDLKLKLSKSAYKARLPVLQKDLFDLQRACWRAELATIVVIEGWDTSGKGSVISKLTERLEPRGFRLHTIREARTYATQLPWLWRFWQQIPRFGEMAIFDQSWYGRLFIDRVDQGLRRKDWHRRCQDLIRFERCLSDDRYQLIKCFLHISKKEKKQRLKALSQNEATRWKVTEKTWRRHQHYRDYKRTIEETLERTDSDFAPWHLIAATDKRWARLQVLNQVIQGMRTALESRSLPLPEHSAPEVLP